MASESKISVILANCNRCARKEETYRLAYLPSRDKAEISIALSQVTPNGESVLSVTSMATQRAKEVTRGICNPSKMFRERLLSLMVAIIMANLKKTTWINIAVETGSRFEAFSMSKLQAIGPQTMERFILPRALQMLGENMLEPTAVSQCYYRKDYEVSYTVYKVDKQKARSLPRTVEKL